MDYAGTLARDLYGSIEWINKRKVSAHAIQA
jgi:hypothetical protein